MTQEHQGNSTIDTPPVSKLLTSYYCQQAGHKASVRPVRRAKITGSCCAPRQKANLAENRDNQSKDPETGDFKRTLGD